MSFRRDLGRDGPAVGLQGWDMQHCSVAELMISARLSPSTIGLSSLWDSEGMLQQRAGRIWGEMLGHPAK